jgi:NADPH:quinone reductase-like Zn-dependent oxidoreductase
VVAVGPAVTNLSVGEEVFGSGRGAFAEYALVADDRLAHKPLGLSFEHAATLPGSGVTALQAVHDHGRVQEGQRVLVTGASDTLGARARLPVPRRAVKAVVAGVVRESAARARRHGRA